jgi:hypothetical protein
MVLALLLWNSPNGAPFPLLDSSSKPLTVLGAYDLCRPKFKAAASLSNEKAVSNDGALLETLAHAATTLASCSGGLKGTDSSTFLAFICCLLGTAVFPQDVANLRA